jgi:predicted regulator of Ras-like GTPase activity (Roadblock/LC7/MglB family)
VTATSRSTDLGWLLDDLVARVHGADRVVVLSSDGLLMARSRSTAQADAEHLSAMASAYQSLSRGVGRHFAGGMVRQTVVELERAFLLVIAAGEGSVLALLATEDAELGQIAYEMHLLVRRVAASLVAAPRVAGAGTP